MTFEEHSRRIGQCLQLLNIALKDAKKDGLDTLVELFNDDDGIRVKATLSAEAEDKPLNTEAQNDGV